MIFLIYRHVVERKLAKHETTVGVDYQLTHTLAFEARYDRRRLDHVIEDSAIFNPAVGETFVIVNPGQGIDKTYDQFFNFLYGVNNSNCGSACPQMISTTAAAVTMAARP